MAKMQAYLGPNKPETLAEGNGPANSRYAVVRQDRTTGAVSWVGSYIDYSSAIAALTRNTTHLHFGIQCSVRPAEANVLA
jgi:hypothetical protein